MAEIVLDGVSKTYSEHVLAVDRLSLTVRDEEFLVLVGPSGCGKSTTLRLIAGLERPSAGQVRLAGRVVNDLPPRQRNTAMVFQNHALFPHLTVSENMAFGLRLRYGGWWRRTWRRVFARRPAAGDTVGRAEIYDRVRDAARRLGVAVALDRRAWQLSGGQRQRVALGQAIVRRPAAFLFDEPLSNLDAKLRNELRGELKQLQRQLKTTTVYVTHDQSEALTLGDRVAVMENGRLHQIGSPVELYNHPKNRHVAAILGSPPMNFVEGSIVRDESPWRFQANGWGAGLSARTAGQIGAPGTSRVVLGVRPEDVLVEKRPGSHRSEEMNTASPVTGKVRLVEFTGDASIVHVELPGPDAEAGHTILAKTAAQCSWRPEDTVAVRFDFQRASWFDCDSGVNLALD